MTIRQEIAQIEAAMPPVFYIDFDGSKRWMPLTDEQEAAARRALMLEELLDLRHLTEEWLESMHFGWCCDPQASWEAN